MKPAPSKTTTPVTGAKAKPKSKSGTKPGEAPRQVSDAAVPPTPTPVAEAAPAPLTSPQPQAPASQSHAEPAEPEAARPVEMSREALIRHGAYLRYLRRRPDEGSEVDDWLGAEAEHAGAGRGT